LRCAAAKHEGEVSAVGLLYTKMKIFHYRDKLDSLSPDVKTITPPVQIRIKPTNICSHNCRYCAYRTENLQLGKNMDRSSHIPKAKIMELMDDVINMDVKAITFSGGGDPFCYPYLTDAVKLLAGSQVKFASLTNGSRLKGEVAEIFAHCATWLRVSMDGWDDESYSYYRGVGKGEFTAVMDNMEKFRKLGGKCYLGVVLIIDEYNSSRVFESIRKLKNIGVSNVKVSPCIVSNSGLENNNYHKPFFKGVKEQISKAVEFLGDENFEIFDAYHELDGKFDKKYTWCPYIQILPVIGADLNVYSCQDKAYNLDNGLIGSIRDRRFSEYWFSDKSRFYRINPSTACNHHCVSNQKNRMLMEYFNADKEHLDFV
jgi:MoaA/NifB/PqqE/SkfB family radical SAM enzyme